MNKIIISFCLITSFLCFSTACKHNNQQNDLINSLEESGVEIPNEVKQQQGFSLVDILFPLGGLFMFGVFVFAGVKQFKRKKAEFGYALGDINERVNSLKNNPEVSDKMSDEQKKNLDDVLDFFNKGIRKN